MMRRCSKCGEEKPATAEFFYKDASKKDGLAGYCKPCASERNRAYRVANVDVINEKGRAYYVANAEAIGEQHRAYHAANAEAISERLRAYREANPEIHKASKQRRAARKRELPATLTAQEWQYAIDYFHGCCAVCGRPLKDLFATHTAAMDHWIPLTKGGGTTADNIVPLCHGKDGCNNHKGNALPEAWLVRRFGKREAKKILARINAYFASIEE